MPPSLGQKLKQARDEQGLSLADISHKTRIPVQRLQDLEDDHYNTFGSLTYAKSFLQTYAGLLGVDPNPVTDHMDPAPLGGARDYRYLTESLGRWIGVNPDRSLMPEARPVRSVRLPVVIFAVLGMILVGGVIWAKAVLTDTFKKAPVTESRPASRREASSRDTTVGNEEIRPAVANRAAATENVPIRKALPVEDDARTKAKK